MKILYGVSGEGFGHSSRAKEFISHLEKKGHKVLVVTYGQAYKPLKKFNVLKIKGIRLFFNKKGLSISKTILESIKVIEKNLKNWNKIKKRIDKFNPDICISDMEPLVPIISYWKNLPLISIDNQHRLTHLELNVPKKYKRDFLIAKIAVDRCISDAKAFLILSFTKGKIKRKNTYVANSLLRKEIVKLNPSKTKNILVYQTKPNKELLKILKQIHEKFIVYGYNKNKKDSNLLFKKTGLHFIKDLASTKAVIATSGFTLMSESIYLKKPYFAIPLKGQFEQTLNALFLKKAGLGDYSEEPTKNELTKFLKNLKKYNSNLKKNKTNPREALEVLDKILKKISKPKL